MGTFVSITVTTTATRLLTANTARTSFLMVNNGSASVFIGENNTVTTSNGLPIASGGQLAEDRGVRLYLGDVFGIVASGTEDMRVWERTSNP